MGALKKVSDRMASTSPYGYPGKRPSPDDACDAVHPALNSLATSTAAAGRGSPTGRRCCGPGSPARLLVKILSIGNVGAQIADQTQTNQHHRYHRP